MIANRGILLLDLTLVLRAVWSIVLLLAVVLALHDAHTSFIPRAGANLLLAASVVSPYTPPSIEQRQASIQSLFSKGNLQSRDASGGNLNDSQQGDITACTDACSAGCSVSCAASCADSCSSGCSASCDAACGCSETGGQG